MARRLRMLSALKPKTDPNVFCSFPSLLVVIKTRRLTPDCNCSKITMCSIETLLCILFDQIAAGRITMGVSAQYY